MPITFKGMNRIEKLEIPEEALREILYNVIIHKDYTGVHIQMRVWDDHVEIWNDGELPVGYTPATLMQQHSSKPRNRNIANAFFKAGFIDAWGRGYKKICEGFKEAGLPMPDIEAVDGGVRITFKRRNGIDNATETQQKMQQKMQQKTQQKIVELIKENSYITTLLDERNNAMIQGVVTEMTKSAPRVSQAMLSKRLGDAEKRMPSKKKLLKAISQTYDEGLWWGSTAWATVYRALKYDGSMSAFAREMQDLLWGMDFVYEPTADSISKPLRDGRMMAEIG